MPELSPNLKVSGRWQEHLPSPDTSLVIADPPYDPRDINPLVQLVVARQLPTCLFLRLEDLFDLEHRPHQYALWLKPESTKNTTRHYGRFAEVIAFYFVNFHGRLHWSNRTGLFTDRLLGEPEHPHKKPETLIERLIRNHYPGHGLVYDPCAGSFTVHDVCVRLGLPSYSVEVTYATKGEA